MPNITPIFSRIWLMKITVHLDLLMGPGELAERLAHQPGLQADRGASPISPSISARGINAATESMTITSTALERTSISQISSACSPGVGLGDHQLVQP